MNKKGKITIGIPVFNNEKIIKKRIDDITAQSYQNFTIIISDNNSTDKTREICEKISQNDDRIVFFHHEQNMGPYWNFNFVLDKAETEYFVWVAGDDIWSKKFLEKNIKFLEENDDYVGSIGETSLFNRNYNRNYNENIKLIENSKNPCVVGLIAEPSRVLDVRKNRMNFLNEEKTSSYTDIEKIRLELEMSKNIFKKNNWPVIDVTRKSVEETAASIIKIYDIIKSR